MDFQAQIQAKKAELAALNQQAAQLSEKEQISAEEQATLDGLFASAEALMAEIQTLSNQAKVAAQGQFLENARFAVTTAPSLDSLSADEPSSAQARDDQALSNRERFFVNNGRKLKASPITMRMHHGGLKAFTKGERDLDNAFRVGMFLSAAFLKNPGAVRWCRENGLTYRNQYVESINVAGGVLVPEEMSERIIYLVDQYGVARQDMYVESMASETKFIPRQKEGFSAKHVGEMQKSDWQDPRNFDQVNLVAKKVEVPTSISMELDADSAINVVDRLTVDGAQAFSRREDEDGFNGAGDSSSGGIVGILPKLVGTGLKGGVVAAAGHNTFATIDDDDLTALLAQCPLYANGGVRRWYMSNYAYEMLVGRLSLKAGGNTIGDIAQGWTPMFYGHPVRFTEVMPGEGTHADEGMLAFGALDLSSTFGNRMEVMIRTSDHFLFDQDGIAIKMSERYDIVNHNVGDEVKAGPVVVLVGAS